MKAALKEVKMALLEADVSFKVVKQFIKSVEARAVGQDVLNSLTPGQMVIKIVNEEMVSLLGSETTEIALKPGKRRNRDHDGRVCREPVKPLPRQSWPGSLRRRERGPF